MPKETIILNMTIMKRFQKKCLVSIVLVALSAGVVMAQTSSTPEDRADKWDKWMKENLTLTSDQEVPAHDINLKYALQSEKLKADDGSRMEKLKKLKAIDADKDVDMKKVLTADQFKIYQDKKKEFQKKLLQNARQ
jgi:hypothetical protein